MILPDQIARDKFTHNLDENFSVIAPAGVGKTTAIAKRVMNIFKNYSQNETLVVVTYTEKAANELKSKTLKLAIEEFKNNANCNVFEQIDRVFFGTIHSFAAEIIREFGMHEGFGSDFKIFDDEQDIWNVFLSEDQSIWDVVAQSNTEFDVTEITKIKFIKDKKCPSENPAEDLLKKYLAEKFFEFKKHKSMFAYDDLIIAANKIIGNIAVKLLIIKRKFSIILDEAQDTDSEQFKLLLTIANSAHECWPLSDFNGKFSMVGDPQQAIYMSRANVEDYIKIHKTLTDSAALQELTFDTTMRCSKSIVKFVNNIFENVFANNSSNVPFVHLENFSSAIDGCVSQIKLSQQFCHESESELIAKFFIGKIPSDFGVEKWSNIAILAPRNSQLERLSYAFENASCRQTQTYFAANEPNDNFSICLIALLKIFLIKSDIIELVSFVKTFFNFNNDEILMFLRTKKFESNNKDFIRLMGLLTTDCSMPIDEVFAKILHFIKTSVFADKFFNKTEINIEQMLCRIMSVFDHVDVENMANNEIVDFFEKNIQEIYSAKTIDDDRIQLVSFHKSKGLEWPVVILPFLNDQRKEMLDVMHGQLAKENVSIKWKENEQRMLYVACTRAKSTLILVNFQPKEQIKKLNANMNSSLSLLSKTNNLEGIELFSAQLFANIKCSGCCCL